MGVEKEDENADQNFDPGVISKRHPLKRFVSRNPLWRYISKNVPLPFIITEFFFGAWMSCIAINLIGGFADASNPGIVLYAISAAYMVNIIWGIIDGWSYNLCVTITESEDDRAIHKLLINRDDGSAKARLTESLDAGPAHHLGPGDKEKVMDMILSSCPHVDPGKAYKFRKKDYHVVISFVMIDVLMATLTVLPFIILKDMGTALIFSRVVTVSMFACVAYVSAKYLNRNWVFWVAVLSVLGVLIAQMTWLYS
ncbi:MAG: hypothetical protein LBE48_04540 [Methanomassiliicoccaceae archaeon]|jgi:hypothetical protein|nr:hypothetical protein [Methanomassiliicoccaceae archaeon]